MDTFSLIKSLTRAKDENEVTKIIDQDENIRTKGRWIPIDKNENNIGIIDAQGRLPERALVEKITNAIDAVLIKEAKNRGINPESDNAPNTMQEALEQFFGIKNGDLTTLTNKERDQLASLIYVVAENLQRKVCNFYIIDKGEGQSPSNFDRTFLKFGGNKQNTHFVHGRFGTGSFGVLPNCGENKYQLIVSKNFQDSEADPWGWTLIRKNLTRDIHKKHAWYEYLTLDGKIPVFHNHDLAELLRSSIGYKKIDLSSFTSGTAIKLFNYDLAHSTDIDRSFFKIVNRYLFSPALPFRILDSATTSNVGPGKEVEGNINRLKNNFSAEEGDKRLIIEDVNLPKLGKVNIEIYITKKRADKKKSYIESEWVSTNNETVFFIRNGQSHGELPRQFIKSDLGLGFIAKDMAIYVDCTNTMPIDFDEIFPPTRDSMRNNKHRNAVQAAIRKELRDFEELKEINQQRRSEIISVNIENIEDFEEFINDLYKSDPLFKKMFTGNLKVSDLSKRGGSKENNYLGNYFPTKLIPLDKGIRTAGVKEVPINSYVKIVFEIDATNDYLYRENDRGELITEFNGEINSKRLFNGRLTIKVTPTESAVIGATETLNIIVRHPYEDDATLRHEVKIKYSQAIEKGKNIPQPRPSRTAVINLPKFTPLSMKEWTGLGYDSDSACQPVTELDDVSSRYILKEVHVNKELESLNEFINSRRNISETKIEEMKDTFMKAVYISAIVVHQGMTHKKHYKSEDFVKALTYIGKCLPFAIFSLREKLLRSISLN